MITARQKQSWTTYTTPVFVTSSLVVIALLLEFRRSISRLFRRIERWIRWTGSSASEADVFPGKDGRVADLDDDGNIGFLCWTDMNVGLVQSSSSRL